MSHIIMGVKSNPADFFLKYNFEKKNLKVTFWLEKFLKWSRLISILAKELKILKNVRNLSARNFLLMIISEKFHIDPGSFGP